MYSSLRQWVNIPISIIPFVKRTGTGDKEFGEPYTIYCYPCSEIKVIRNNIGVEVVSNTQLYIDGKESITDFDLITFEGKEHTIQAISNFYREGRIDVKVVYL